MSLLFSWTSQLHHKHLSSAPVETTGCWALTIYRLHMTYVVRYACTSKQIYITCTHVCKQRERDRGEQISHHPSVTILFPSSSWYNYTFGCRVIWLIPYSRHSPSAIKVSHQPVTQDPNSNKENDVQTSKASSTKRLYLTSTRFSWDHISSNSRSACFSKIRAPHSMMQARKAPAVACQCWKLRLTYHRKNRSHDAHNYHNYTLHRLHHIFLTQATPAPWLHKAVGSSPVRPASVMRTLPRRRPA